MENVTSKNPSRPQITDYSDMVKYFNDMIVFRKQSESSFSVYSATRLLRRVSPALISLVLKGKRKITFDRVDEYAKLLGLNSQEKFFLKNWVRRSEDTNAVEETAVPFENKQRKEVGTHILQDWINIYVKDCFLLEPVQKQPDLIYRLLGHHANSARIDKSIQFLLREGYLRKTVDNRIVVETNHAVRNQSIPSKSIRNFHKQVLSTARSALDLFPVQERFANMMALPLNEKNYQEMLEMIHEFMLKVQDFSAQNSNDGEKIYQLVLNLSPIGGKPE